MIAEEEMDLQSVKTNTSRTPSIPKNKDGVSVGFVLNKLGDYVIVTKGDGADWQGTGAISTTKEWI
ncbi:MAG: hypothetical protein ACI30I_09090 [Parabacteroides sp.]